MKTKRAIWISEVGCAFVCAVVLIVWLSGPAGAMESQGTGDREGRGWGSLLIWLPGLLVLYVLSVGPVARLADKGIIPDEPAKTIHAPLIWLDWHSATASYFLDWYMHLWGGR